MATSKKASFSSAGRTIEVPEVAEIRERLAEKLREYRGRIDRYRERNRVDDLGIIIKPDSVLLDSIYKAALVDALLQSGTADSAKIHADLLKRFKGFMAEDLFQNAVNVIDDYMRTGGGRTAGGSGFLDDKLFNSLLGADGALVMPTDPRARAWLKRKYHEYLGRNIAYEQSVESTVDLPALKQGRYKTRILERLQSEKSASLRDLANELEQEERGSFDKFEFCNAADAVRGLLLAAQSESDGSGRPDETLPAS